METGLAPLMQQLHISVILCRFMFGFLISTLFGAMAWAQTEEFPKRIDGDIGLGIYYTRSIIRGNTDQVSVLPYGNFDYGRMSVRIDTLSFKTVQLGYGYLEIAGRFSQDGFSAAAISLRGLANKQTSIPLGLGTLQITPIGAFFINALHDFNKSKGNLFEGIYIAELGTPRLTFYPLAGAEYQSSEYVRYYYGISAQEAALSQYTAYQPTGAFNPLLGLLVDARLTEKFHLNLYLRRNWLGNSIQSSPIVSKSTMDTGFIAVSYRF
ncbi:MAG: MipA/OmpV family protein [Gallionella sp.]